MARPKRRLSQNFLADPRILGRIAEATGAGPDDTVLEIGPGPGGLTEQLTRRAGRVIAIERDADLIPALRARVPSATVVEGDALLLDWAELAGPGFLLTGNIPYHITSPLLERALTPPRPRRVVFLMQREVADRLAAESGTKAYGALTVGVRCQATVERLFSVPAGAFHPPPKVASALVRLTPLDAPAIAESDTAAFRRLVVGLFGFRRKQLARGVREFTGWPASEAVAALVGVGLDPTDRPETVAPEAFVALFYRLVDAGWQQA